MLENYKDDDIVASYLTMLKDLRQPFHVLYEDVNKDFDTDTEEGKKHIEKILVRITELGKNINEIRNEIIG